MSISINSKMSGFRKWAEAHPRNNDGRIEATGDLDIKVAYPDAHGKTADQRPPRPWLVPGIGKL